MRRYRKKARHHKAKSIPLAPIIPLAFVTFNALSQSGSAAAKMNDFSARTIGYIPSSGTFAPSRAVPFWGATIAGVIVHKAANKVGVNNYVRRATFGYLSL
jgi:hypothetical protein